MFNAARYVMVVKNNMILLESLRSLIEVRLDFFSKMSGVSKRVHHFLIHREEVGCLVLYVELFASFDQHILNSWVLAHVGMGKEVMDGVVIQPQVLD